MKEASRKNFLTKKELAEYLGLSVFTIDTWVSQRREIPFVRMGRRVMFDMLDVNDWIEKKKIRPVDHERNSRGHLGISS